MELNKSQFELAICPALPNFWRGCARTLMQKLPVVRYLRLMTWLHLKMDFPQQMACESGLMEEFASLSVRAELKQR